MRCGLGPTFTKHIIALRAPNTIPAVLVQAEAVHGEIGRVTRAPLERTIKILIRQIVRDSDMRVIRKAQLTVERSLSYSALEPLAVADAHHDRHEDDG